MKTTIYFSCSKCEEKEPEAFRRGLENAGVVIPDDNADALIKADALFIYLSGSDHKKVKDDLNVALNSKIPIAYFVSPETLTDSGLEIQLGLAEKQEDINALKTWTGKVISRKKSKKRFKTIFALLTILLLLCISGIGIRFYLNYEIPNSSIPEYPFFPSGTDHTSITELDLSGKCLKDISFLSEATGLIRLDLSGNDISDVSALSELKDLTYLDLSDNAIEDISPVAKLDKLQTLDISNNKIKDINTLLALKDLKQLDISNDPIEDMTLFEFMENVEIIGR